MNNAFCDDNHGFHQPGPKQACSRKMDAKAPKEMLPSVKKIIDEVRSEQTHAKHGTR